MSLLAVDVGSSSCKGVAFSEDGRMLARKTSSYCSVVSSHSLRAEMPAENFWRAFATVTHAISAELSKDPVEVLAISSHGETFVAVDSQNRPLAPAILNMDNRAIAQADHLIKSLGSRNLFDITGLTPHCMYPAAKFLWLSEHDAEMFASAVRFLAVPSFLLARLGLPPYIDYSLASRFLAFDVRKLTWSPEILSFCRVYGRLPELVPAGTIAGKITGVAAAELGLRSGTMVVVGGHDQPCAALGSGVIDSGRVSASLGTYECLVAASRAPALNDGSFAANLNTYCHVVPDRYVTLAYFPSGIMLEWYLRLIHATGDSTEESSIDEWCAQLERETYRVPSGILATPHLLGTCNPDFNPTASGVVVGIRPSTTRSDLYQAAMEGIACEFAGMATLLEEAVGSISDVYVSGGGLRSPFGLHLRASLARRKLQVMKCPEAVCLGTAILAGVAAGKYRSIPKAVQQLVQVSQTIVPDDSTGEKYKFQMSQYRLLYSSLAPLREAQTAFTREEA